MRTVRGLAILVAAGLVIAAFWWLDFRAASSESSAEREISTFGSGAPPDRVDGIQPKLDLAIHVSGEGDLAALRETLARQLPTLPTVGKVEVLAKLPEKPDRPVLGVEVGEEHVLWTPVYASARLKVGVVFTSNGDLTWHGQKPVAMPIGGQRTVWTDGSLKLEDTTRGVTSRRAYRRQLAEQVAGEVTDALGQVLASQPVVAGR